MLFALGFVSMFVIGGLSGIYLAAVPIDIHLGHVLRGRAHPLRALRRLAVHDLRGIYYWLCGRMYDERLGKLHFWLTFIGFSTTFFPMHWLRIQGMPACRRLRARFADLNLFISISRSRSVPRRSSFSTT
jgi:cytochrome c oxidase subunit 1